MIKIAMCFIINYEQILNKEEIWKKWIEYNKDIINIYFYYKDYEKINSQWIKQHCIPPDYIKETDYFHIIPAYIGLMKYSLKHDKNNNWFCFLTDSCAPIIHPLEFRYLFLNNHKKSIFSWCKSNWNVNFTKRANLHLLNKSYHLKNTPYFIFNRINIQRCFHFMKNNKELFITISNGSIANESLFAIILKHYNALEYVINKNSTLTDWSRMESSTSPYLFKDATRENINFIIDCKLKNKYIIFLRKVHTDFPNDILEQIIFTEPPNYKLLKSYCLIYYFYNLIFQYWWLFVIFPICISCVNIYYCFHL